MREQMTLVSLFLASGLLMVFLSLPLIMGRIPRNGWYGFRVPKTLASDDVWYPANRFAGRGLFHCGRIIVAGSLAMMAALLGGVPLTVDQVSYLGLLLTMLPLAVVVYRSFRYLSRL